MKFVKFQFANNEEVFINPAKVRFVRGYAAHFSDSGALAEIIFNQTGETETDYEYDSVVVKGKPLAVVRKLEQGA